jgi:predicted O-methyltransferase YrrM
MEHFGGWAMAHTTYNYIRSILPDGKTILEIGSGYGTGEMAKHYKMYSIEANIRWVGKYNSTYIHAPIKMYDTEYTAPNIEGNAGWHNVDSLSDILPTIRYDLIFIDGPEGKYGRGGFLKHINLFNTDIPMIFDDINRPYELILMQNVSELVGRPYTILEDNVTGVIL